MSMKDYPIMMFGVNTDDINIKPRYWMPWDELQKLPENAPRPQYEEFDDFVDCAINDYDIACESNDDSYYIGIFPRYDWQSVAGHKFKTETEAAKYLAKALAPFCDKSEAEIEAACDYIEDTYCG